MCGRSLVGFPSHARDLFLVACPMPGKRSEKQEDVIVGHVLLALSRVFHLFLKNGGRISVTVAIKRRNKGIGLEIPATYTFYHKKSSKLNKLRGLPPSMQLRLQGVDRNASFIPLGQKGNFN